MMMGDDGGRMVGGWELGTLASKLELMQIFRYFASTSVLRMGYGGVSNR